MTPYYADDLVTLYHGDCREVIPALALHEGVVDTVVTDPPYGETSLEWDRWPGGWPTLVAGVADSMWCFGSMRMFLTQCREFDGWRLSQDVVWHKTVTSFNPGDRFNRVHEHALHWYRGDWRDVYHVPARVPAVKRQMGDIITRSANEAGVLGARGAATTISDGLAYVPSVLAAKVARSGAVHPTEKPVSILRHLITYACPPGGLVLDPFAGSGAVLDAARLTGRRAIGIEAAERYCELIAKRLAQDILDFGEAS